MLQKKKFQTFFGNMAKKEKQKESLKQLLMQGRILKLNQQKNLLKLISKRFQEDSMTRNIQQQKHFKR